VPNLTVSEKLLVSAWRLENAGNRPFSAEDLVVAAWQAFPDAFGLAGYGSDYPDSNRVFVEIMGSKPIRSQGYLAKVGAKRYQLTEAGRQRAVRLLPGSPPAAKADLSRDSARELRRLLASRAMQKYKADRVDDITFHDACSFWAISPRSSRKDVEARLANFSAIVTTGRGALAHGAVTLEHNAQPVAPGDIRGLGELHDLLLRRFDEELSVIRERRDERTA
jgi:hypothetical protein